MARWTVNGLCEPALDLRPGGSSCECSAIWEVSRSWIAE